jgi:hypothetical protein
MDDDVDDSAYYTPKLIVFDSGLAITLLDVIVVVVVVGLVVSAWVYMNRLRLKQATAADVAGFFPRRRRRRRSRRR